MRVLRLVGPGEDGTSVVLEADTGEHFSLPVDDRLRAASRADRAQMGQIEAAAAGPLRPRDIQIRVRAGESAEQLAEAAGMPVERVMRFAYPVLAERTRVADEARRARARRTGDGHLVPFGELVDSRFGAHGVEPESVNWDAFRRPDGGWTVTADVTDERFPIRAKFSFSLGNRTVSALDDVAADLLSGRAVRALSPAPELDDTGRAAAFGRLSAVPDSGWPADPAARPRRERAFTHPLPVSVDDEMLDQDVFDQELSDADAPAGLGASAFSTDAADLQNYPIEHYLLERAEERPGASRAPAPTEATDTGAPPAEDAASIHETDTHEMPSLWADLEVDPVVPPTESTDATEVEDRAVSAAAAHRRGGRHGDKPRMPSWDDILLGVRRKSE